MMAEFRMPSLGADMEAGKLVEWLVKPGDEVKRGDIVAIVETEKADIEVEIFTDGVVEELVVSEGRRVPVGTVLATVRTEGEAATAGEVEIGTAPGSVPERPRPHASPVVRRLAARLGVALESVTGTGAGGAITHADVERAAARPPPPLPAAPIHTPAPFRAMASPLAAARARELSVDLQGVTGTGPGGAITREDVEQMAEGGEAPAVAPAMGWTPERQLAMRRAIANLMARSKREVPHYYLGTRIDLTRATSWLASANEPRPAGERILMAVLLVKAAARAVKDVPEMNGFWIDDGFRSSEAVHAGIAVSLRHGGLIAPCIHDVDQLGIDDLSSALRDLVRRARAGQLRASEMSDGTITVSNMGDQGVETVYGVIYPPQVALLGLGRVAERPWAEAGRVDVRPTIQATLSADHRASDGHRGGIFLAAIDRLMQEPEAL
jgi:pyruvate dehydrogenase E2 component (dihydrolipoamide acetyltransferase)